jgi:TfoX/Sxy family transcriptional regulator of competence genes
MPFNEHLARRVRDMLAAEHSVKEKRMFGGLAFMVNGHMCCGVVNENLVLRVGAEEYERALSRPHARVMDFTGREMKGFVYVDPQGWGTTARLRNWIELSLKFVLSLPPK